MLRVIVETVLVLQRKYFWSHALIGSIDGITQATQPETLMPSIIEAAAVSGGGILRRLTQVTVTLVVPTGSCIHAPMSPSRTEQRGNRIIVADVQLVLTPPLVLGLLRDRDTPAELACRIEPPPNR